MLPSFLPTGSSSWTPTHAPEPPGISFTSPTYATVPLRVSSPPTRQRLPASIPRLRTSSAKAAILACSRLGPLGSNRPSFSAFFQARTESVLLTYSSSGSTYLSTSEVSVKLSLAPGGRVSTIYVDCLAHDCSPVTPTAMLIERQVFVPRQPHGPYIKGDTHF